jgi:hypothetical protein
MSPGPHHERPASPLVVCTAPAFTPSATTRHCSFASAQLHHDAADRIARFHEFEMERTGIEPVTSGCEIGKPPGSAPFPRDERRVLAAFASALLG